MRTRKEVKRAHDLMAAVISVDIEIPRALDQEHCTILIHALDVLCWVLGHNENDKFNIILFAIEDEAAHTGWR